MINAACAQLIQPATCKGEKAGRCVTLVDPKNTSQLCSNCDEIFPKRLSKRIHSCNYCGYVQDRDIKAARNIMKRALALNLAWTEPSELIVGGDVMGVLNSTFL